MDAKELFLKHGEKIALGLAGLIVVVGVVALLGGGYQEAEAIDELVDRVEEQRKAEFTPPFPDLEDLERIQGRWQGAASPAPLRKWAMHRRHYIKRVLGKKPVGPGRKQAEHGVPGIRVTDKGTDFVALEITTDVNLAEVVRLELYRTMKKDLAGEPEFPPEPYRQLDPGEGTFRDTEGIRPRAMVWYKLVSHAQAVGEALPILPNEAVLSSAVEQLRVPSDVWVLVIDIKPGSFVSSIPAEASIKIFKWFPEQQKWRTRLYRVKVGEMIGKVETLTTDLKVDWSTGFELEAAELRETQVKIGGRSIPKQLKWIRIREVGKSDDSLEEVLNTKEYRDFLEALEKSGQVVLPEPGAPKEGPEKSGEGDEKTPPGPEAPDGEDEDETGSKQ